MLRSLLRKYSHSPFLQNVSWQYLALVWNTGLGFIYTLLVVKGLGATDFGLLSLGLSFAGLVFGVVELRLHEALIKYLAEFWERQDNQRVVATIKLSLLADVTTGLLAFLLVLGAAPWAQRYLLRDSRGLLIVLLCGVATLFSNIIGTTSVGILRVLDRYKWNAFVTMSSSTLKLVLTLLLLHVFHGGLFSVLLLAGVTSLVTNVALGTIAWKAVRQRIDRESQSASIVLLKPRLGEMTKFVLSNYGVSVNGVVLRDLDINVLGLYASADSVAIYKIAKNFASLIWQITDPVLFVIFPELARFHARQMFAEMYRFIKRLTIVMLAISSLLFVCSSVLVPVFVVWVIDPAYVKVGPVFHLLVWWILIGMPLIWGHSFVGAEGRPDLSLKAALLGNGVTLLLYFGLIPSLHERGAALAYAIGLALTSLLTVGLAWHAGLLSRSSVSEVSV